LQRLLCRDAIALIKIMTRGQSYQATYNQPCQRSVTRRRAASARRSAKRRARAQAGGCAN
jgi:hypothetical protein